MDCEIWYAQEQVTGCHGKGYSGIHISRVTKWYARLMKMFCIPSKWGQNHKWQLVSRWAIPGAAGATYNETDTSEHQALWRLPEFRTGCRDPLLPPSLQGRVSSDVGRIRLPRAQGLLAPVLQCTQGEETLLPCNWGFLVTFSHQLPTIGT